MTQQELERELCAATGEGLSNIRRLGFSLADPMEVDFDPEPYDLPQIVDWDGVECRRNVMTIDPGHLVHRAA